MDDLVQQLTDNLVVGGLAVFALSLGFFAITYLHRRRQMLHRERMASLVKGLHYAGIARDVLVSDRTDNRDYLLRGLRWLFGALGVSGAVGGYQMLQPAADLTNALRGLLVGLLPGAIGLAYLVYSWISRRRQKRTALPQVLYRPVGRRA